ncbi:TetR family transcriptional regulator [Leptospira stimsonii]|uniref:TetR/AcrR family transcriptional regulator n=1 Tax=Leptospira stimsonii TaxID=2202203 RepID=A0A4V3JVE0_9LEPT|nr:TetR family transcriptional regulator [Leptospira stimsonii]RHX88384.1 TetR/AcrR family transcriptional regulator [Leptospira stimsonii]TGK22128.1 TetR/AcrR family transcriptional regulator [Leptospira stimsonii]TGM16856.1 TetR/AcrR family transcriptional regulator [Leptospira stimsonii]
MPRTGLTPEELYNKALDSTETEIRKNGVERLKLTEIARDLKVSHAVLYKFFSDKQALLDEVSKRWLDRIDRELERISAKEEPVDEILKEWFLTLHSMKRKKILMDPKLFGAFNLSAEKTRPFVVSHLATMSRLLEDLISKGMKSGTFSCTNAEEGARILFQGTAAFHHPRLVLESIEEERTPLLEKLLDTLISGLKTKPSEKSKK